MEGGGMGNFFFNLRFMVWSGDGMMCVRVSLGLI